MRKRDVGGKQDAATGILNSVRGVFALFQQLGLKWSCVEIQSLIQA